MSNKKPGKPEAPAQKAEDKPFLRFPSEHYDPSGNPLPAYLFHPATLAAMRVLGDDVLGKLVPQGGFEPYIHDMHGYNERMAKAMEDKVDYLQRIEDAEIIIDFGCADGKMLKYLQANDPSKHYIGYDISQPMLDLAREDNPGNITFTDQWDRAVEEAQKEADKRGGATTLVLSSILHEIYAYLPKQEVQTFWQKVFDSGFDNIAIRDMMTNRNIDRPSNPEDVQKIHDNYDANKIAEWENRWGSLNNNKSMVHFLLTCPYKENWVRELQEDYLPMSMQELVRLIPPEYEISFAEHYTLPYFKNKTKKDFGVSVEDNTHMKMILKKARTNLQSAEHNKTALLETLDSAEPGTEVSCELAHERLNIQTTPSLGK